MKKEDYLAKYGDVTDEVNEKSKLYKAFEIALDTRKFEIELYWKRATYFWAFIAAIFVGYMATWRVADDENNHLLLMFSCLGFIFSLAWYLVNRGSKFWQVNWEKHVDAFEEAVIGPLYQTHLQDKHACFCDITGPYPFSVSKINQLLSLYVSMIWLVLILKSAAHIHELLPELSNRSFSVSILIISVLMVIIIFIKGKSKIPEGKIKYLED